MPDYKEMYLRLFRASEQAISALIQAQRECEALYIDQPELEFKMLSISSEKNKDMEENE